MKFRILLILLIITIFVYGNDFINLDNLHRGMKGYCVTVFHDTILDTFNVEIIDIIKNFNSSNSIILVKCYGENVEKTGIAQGMSGSPVYFDNKLAGSLSYTWSNLKEPIAGVVPINNIIKISEFKHTMGNVEYNFKEISSPIVINGVSDKLLSEIKNKMFFDYPYLIAGNNSGYNKDLKKSHIVPGKGIAIKIVDGDMSAYAIGTCTYVDGNKIYTLGHPMYMKGSIDYPMSEAYIYSIIPKNDISFKLGTAFTDNYSSSLQDRLYGVYAEKGKVSSLVKVSFSLNNKKIVNMKFVKDESFISSIMPLMFVGSVSNNYKAQGPMTIYYKMKIFTHNNGIVNYENTVSSEMAIIQAYIDLQSILTVYLKNIFDNPEIDSIKINTEVKEQYNILTIEDIVLSEKYYSPGDIVKGKIILSEFRGKKITRDFTFKIPENTFCDSMIIIAINGRDEPIFELARSEGKYEFTNINELKNIIESLKPSNSIILKLMNNEIGFSKRNKEFVNLPGTKTLQLLTYGEKPIKAGIIKEKTLITNAVINGQTKAVIKIRRKK